MPCTLLHTYSCYTRQNIDLYKTSKIRWRSLSIQFVKTLILGMAPIHEYGSKCCAVIKIFSFWHVSSENWKRRGDNHMRKSNKRKRRGEETIDIWRLQLLLRWWWFEVTKCVHGLHCPWQIWRRTHNIFQNLNYTVMRVILCLKINYYSGSYREINSEYHYDK